MHKPMAKGVKSFNAFCESVAADTTNKRKKVKIISVKKPMPGVTSGPKKLAAKHDGQNDTGMRALSSKAPTMPPNN